MTTRKGGRPATGSPRWHRNEETGVMHWHAFVTLPTGRPLVPLDPSIPHEDLERAKACAAETSAFFRANGAVPMAVKETVREWSKRWITYRTQRGLASVKENQGRLDRHVLPEIGHLDVTKVTRDDLEAFVEKLDRRGTGEGGYGWKTAVHIWSDVRKMFKDAKDKRGLRVRADNPAEGVEPPQSGSRPALQYLWPSEALAFMACERVPLLYRRLFAVSTYLYCRPEEIEPLEWSDVDLEHATVHIHRAVDRVRDKGKVKTTKTGVARRPPIEPTLLPLLQAMHDAADGKGKVFPKMPPPSQLARKLRDYLEIAGVTRAALFAKSETSRPITWYHATRSTGITWAAVAGLDAFKLMRRAGHERIDTTLLYIREAENLAAGFGEPFPPLPEVLVDPPGGFDQVLIRTKLAAPNMLKRQAVSVGATGFEPVTSSV